MNNLEQGTDGIQDFAANKVGDLSDKLNECVGFPGPLGVYWKLFERYKRGEVVVLWRTTVRGPGIGHPCHLLAVVQGAEIDRGEYKVDASIRELAEGAGRTILVMSLVDGRHQDARVLVFAMAVERTEHDEWMERTLALGAVDWLHIPKELENTGVFQHGDFRTASSIFPAVDVDRLLGAVLIRRIDDREIGSSIGDFVFPQGELPGEIVKRPMQVIENISGDVRDGSGWWLTQAGDDLVCLRVGLVFDSGHIWLLVDVVGDCLVEEGYLMLGPRELVQDLREISSHCSPQSLETQGHE